MPQVDSENSTALRVLDQRPVCHPTDIPPEQIFKAIWRLRREAMDEIARLIRFLDDTDNHMEREPDDDEPWLGFQEAFPGLGLCGGSDDREMDLGTFDRMVDQTHASRQYFVEALAAPDAEHDAADIEPSLGSLDQNDSQERWAAGGQRDLEKDPAESGIGDYDGLLEQTGTQDSFQGTMA
ncbi:hypothetical protein H8B02_17750 [Bradyrhizobium sp. Pear77]|uniref:hypothetical protein n=1 Tax=Bradyrhizobium altum TaxID=1571202 RepID=UPI001E473E66|nr:hypothetical protein [Bradyrhizobium altum]MCC8955212.1 hypothetical protein [Bradyrhizobium altum]